MASVMVSAANPAPKAKRITGPKLLAAERPMKYKPGTLDSKCELRTGVLLMFLILDRNVRREEIEAVDPRFVAGGGDDEAGGDFARRAIEAAQLQRNFSVLDVGAFDAMTENEWQRGP